MKSLLFVGLLALTLAGCSTPGDNTTVAPDRARRMAGLYQVNFISVQNGSQAPVTTALPLVINGKEVLAFSIDISRKAENLVRVTLALTVDPALVAQAGLDAKSLSHSGDMEIRDNGSGYDLYEQGRKVARFDDNTITIQLEETIPQTGQVLKTEVRGKK
jgi:hypothetical protein